MVKIFDKIYPNITIDFPYNFKEFFVFGSLEDMEEVVGNVLENGCKYGKTKIKISIIKLSDVEIRIQISDDGEGLPTKKMNEVFARGFRLDEQTQGTGLGLNIVKDIVEVYKGKVWLGKIKGTWRSPGKYKSTYIYYLMKFFKKLFLCNGVKPNCSIALK